MSRDTRDQRLTSPPKGPNCKPSTISGGWFGTKKFHSLSWWPTSPRTERFNDQKYLKDNIEKYNYDLEKMWAILARLQHVLWLWKCAREKYRGGYFCRLCCTIPESHLGRTVQTCELSPFYIILGKSIQFQVTHLHYTAWPDHGVPQYPQSLANFSRKILDNDTKTPVTVHCRLYFILFSFL